MIKFRIVSDFDVIYNQETKYFVILVDDRYKLETKSNSFDEIIAELKKLKVMFSANMRNKTIKFNNTGITLDFKTTTLILPSVKAKSPKGLDPRDYTIVDYLDVFKHR